MKFKVEWDDLGSRITSCDDSDPDGVSFTAAKKSIMSYLQGKRRDYAMAAGRITYLRVTDFVAEGVSIPSNQPLNPTAGGSHDRT